MDKLIQNVQIESDSDMIRNWEYLHVPITNSVRFFFCNFLLSKLSATLISAVLIRTLFGSKLLLSALVFMMCF